MQAKKWGRIVMICSVFSKVSRAERASYSASKFALDGMTIALAAEMGGFNILANCVSPGVIDTELTRKILGAKGTENFISQVPLHRLGTPNEVAKLVAWLVSPENTFITGQNIAIDGGWMRV